MADLSKDRAEYLKKQAKAQSTVKEANFVKAVRKVLARHFISKEYEERSRAKTKSRKPGKPAQAGKKKRSVKKKRSIVTKMAAKKKAKSTLRRARRRKRA